MYSSTLFGTISLMIKGDEANDILQEVMIKIWNSPGQYDPGKGRLFTWMLNITRNYTIDVIRSKRFKNQLKNTDITEIENFEALKRTDYNPNVIGIKDLIKRLNPDQQKILEVIYFKGYTFQEAADEMNLPLGTLKTKVRSALIELRSDFKIKKHKINIYR